MIDPKDANPYEADTPSFILYNRARDHARQSREQLAAVNAVKASLDQFAISYEQEKANMLALIANRTDCASAAEKQAKAFVAAAARCASLEYDD